jgi:hypothetical protein
MQHGCLAGILCILILIFYSVPLPWLYLEDYAITNHVPHD